MFILLRTIIVNFIALSCLWSLKASFWWLFSLFSLWWQWLELLWFREFNDIILRNLIGNPNLFFPIYFNFRWLCFRFQISLWGENRWFLDWFQRLLRNIIGLLFGLIARQNISLLLRFNYWFNFPDRWLVFKLGFCFYLWLNIIHLGSCLNFSSFNGVNSFWQSTFKGLWFSNLK